MLDDTHRCTLDVAHALSVRDQECGRYGAQSDGAWHVLSTNWNQEALAAASVRADGPFQVFTPRVRKRIPRTDKRPARSEVSLAFPGYLLVWWSHNAPWETLKGREGVERILHRVGDPEAPAIIHPAAMDAMLASASLTGILEEFSDPDLLPPIVTGTAVRITASHLAGMAAVCQWSSDERVRLLLTLSGFRVEMRRDQVEVIE